jgi:hypothetical protein
MRVRFETESFLKKIAEIEPVILNRTYIQGSKEHGSRVPTILPFDLRLFLGNSFL